MAEKMDKLVRAVDKNIVFIARDGRCPDSKGILDQCRSDIVFYIGPISEYNIG